MADPRPEDVAREAARPMEYFTHDAHAFGDVQLRRLFAAYGYAGYGMWWRLCEILAATDGHAIATDGTDGALWADELRLTPEEFANFAAALVRCGLCELDGGMLHAHGMDRRAEKMGLQVAYGKANGRKGGRPKKGVKTPGV